MVERSGKLLNQKQAATELGVTARTLRNWANQHFGPPTLAIGKRRWYAREVIDQWLKARSYA